MTDELIQESWWKRNWKWAVPVGGCLTLIVLLCLFIGTVIFGVSSAFKNSTPYNDAVAKAETNSIVIENIGKPITSDGMMNGNISLNGNDGTANFSMPVKGPNGTGKLHIEGTKTDGVWTYEVITMLLDDTGETINLLE